MSVTYRHGGLRGPTKEPTIGTNWILNMQPVTARNSLRSIFEIPRKLACRSFGSNPRVVHSTTVINNRHTIRVNYHPGNGNFLLVGNDRYQLTQFHFHRPSEEYIGGKPYDMEVHLMYQAQGRRVAGVTVFVKPLRIPPFSG